MSFIYMTDIQSNLQLDFLQKNGCRGFIFEKKQIHSELPQFINLQDAKKSYKSGWLWIEGSALATKKAILEAMELGFKKILLTQNDLSTKDLLEIKALSKQCKCKILGPDASGVYQKGKVVAGLPKQNFSEGSVAILSRSKSMGLALVELMKNQKMGVSYFYGLGSSDMAFSEYSDFLSEIEKDVQTKKIVLIGALGGDFEQRVAEKIQKKTTKPIYFYLAGENMEDYRIHPAIFSVFKEQTLEDKKEKLLQAGAIECQTLFEIPKLLQKETR